MLYHYHTSAGDYTDIVIRSLRLPVLRSAVKAIRNELIRNRITEKDDPILPRIKSVLRTLWIIPDKGNWKPILPIMRPLHIELTKPYWWQDVLLPTSVKIGDSIIPSVNAQIYSLYRRRFYAAIQLPKEVV
jgi:hypothetical protein